MNWMTSWSLRVVTVAMAALLATASLTSASMNVLMMPDRQALAGTAVVLWGNTRFAAGATFTFDFGDTTAVESGTVSDPTYIVSSHTYAAAGMFTARLTVTDATPVTESETAVIMVEDAALLSEFDLRALKINMAIEDGLRWLYVNQNNRTARPTTSWALVGHNIAGTSLVALAFQNHGHSVTGDPTKDIYQDVIQRALNFIFDQVSVQPLGIQSTGLNPAGNDPCVGVGIEAAPCTGLVAEANSYSGYNTSIATFAVAAATAAAPGRVVDAGLGANNGNFVAGKTYAEILQRLINTVAWGQDDGAGGGGGGSLICQEGGFQYYLNQGSDGSAIGWGVLAFLDGIAAGATVPPFVATELANVVAQTSCGMGAGEVALSYGTCYDPLQSCCSSPGNCDGSLNVAKTGVLLQALSFMGVPASDARVQGAVAYISNRWESNADYGYFKCHNGEVDNKGCGYGMFNAFKGFRLYNVSRLAGVMRPAGPGTFPANDWYEDYRDFLVLNQSSANTPLGGNWPYPAMAFSSQSSDTVGSTALAEIILSPTALVLPTNVTLSPETADNPMGTAHTLVATATNASGSPAPGTTVTFRVIAGPDAGVVGTSTTDADGHASFTYTNNLTTGTDQIQVSIGNLKSNVVVKNWGAFDPFGGLVRTNSRNLKLKLHRPPGADGVRCVEAGGSFDNVPFTPFPDGVDDIELDITLSDGDGQKSVCCEFHRPEAQPAPTDLRAEEAVDPITAPVCGSIELVTSTTTTTLPRREDCSNCIDDDGDGLVDYDDSDCCAQPASLEVFRGSFKGLAKKGKGRLRLRSRLGPIGITEQSPLTDDTTIQFSNASGQLLCATVGHEHWMPMHGDTKFWDRSGVLAKGLQDGTIRVKRDGTVIFRTYSNIMDLSRYDTSQMKVTVRVGNKCSRGNVLLRQRKDRLVFP